MGTKGRQYCGVGKYSCSPLPPEMRRRPAVCGACWHSQLQLSIPLRPACPLSTALFMTTSPLAWLCLSSELQDPIGVFWLPPKAHFFPPSQTPLSRSQDSHRNIAAIFRQHHLRWTRPRTLVGTAWQSALLGHSVNGLRMNGQDHPCRLKLLPKTGRGSCLIPHLYI